MFWILDILFRYVQSLLFFPFLPGRQAWDLAVDICLSQLPEVIENPMIFKVFGSPEKCCFVCHFLDFIKKHATVKLGRQSFGLVRWVSICICVCMSVHFSVCPLAQLSQLTNQSFVHSSVCPSVCQSFFLYVSQPVRVMYSSQPVFHSISFCLAIVSGQIDHTMICRQSQTRNSFFIP